MVFWKTVSAKAIRYSESHITGERRLGIQLKYLNKRDILEALSP